ncbi:hypothetical protein [Oceanirhabdus sp. W0125-5]|uniref:hypothetical protein n=1 Tax=Oceanirhabdus sp. W0125-5 TaxID=2999116 RepID=UPI0022F342FB|nr:hypothetical protein [Oceanirhabdus sp. W0125-5]WBW98901.1 hypothetical protein OW730_09205 [Oceanirhabdus sp. W0125-5]
MEGLKVNLSFLKHNIKIVAGKNYIIAAILIGILPVVVGFRLIEHIEMVKLFELYLSLFGIMILGNIMEPENKNTNEVVRSKKLSIINSFIIRILIGIITILAFFSIVITFGKIGHGNFEVFQFVPGAVITALFLGMICTTVHNITRSMAAGYLISFCYYVFERSTLGKYTGDFILFGLLKNNYQSKYNLAGVIIGLILLNMIILVKQKKFD